MHAEDETLMVGVFIKEKENEKEEKSKSEKGGSQKYFCKGSLMGQLIQYRKILY